jgi:hypothetical protein
MPLFYFDLRGDGEIVDDRNGTELADLGAAQAHAALVAGDLMRNNEAAARHWLLEIHDGDRTLLFELPFIAVDRLLDALSANTRQLVEHMARRRRELADVVAASRRNVLQARSTVARARGRPYLAAELGRDVRPPR